MKFNHVEVKEIPDLESVTLENGTRYYMTPTGKKYPSVTTILSSLSKDGIVAWRKAVGEEEANKITKRATNRGTRYHKICENYLNNEELGIRTIFEQQLFESTLSLLDKIDNIHFQEQKLYSDHLRLAGTVDCIAEFEGRLSVIDFKTSTREKFRDDIHSYFIQCAAYAIMYEERTGIPIDKLVIIMAVEDDKPLLFVEKRNTWVKDLLECRQNYELNKIVLTS
jgi:genome maintenance exonuclease 1